MSTITRKDLCARHTKVTEGKLKGLKENSSTVSL